jgi:hypothetical protein
MVDPNIHTPGDGRGARRVYVDGKLMERVVYADTRRGIVRYEAFPRRLDKLGERFIVRTRRGKVTVVPLDG